jgi:hypothetical protein
MQLSVGIYFYKIDLLFQNSQLGSRTIKFNTNKKLMYVLNSMQDSAEVQMLYIVQIQCQG